MPGQGPPPWRRGAATVALLLALGASVVLPCAAVETAAATLGEEAADRQGSATVRVGRTPGRTRIVIDLDESPRYTLVADTSLLNIEITGVALAGELPLAEFGPTPVRRVHARSEDNALFLSLELGARGLRIEHFSLAPDYYGGHRVVVDIHEPVTADSGQGEPAGRGEIAAPAMVADPATQAAPEVAAGESERAGEQSAVLEGAQPEAENALASVGWSGGYAEFGGAYTVAGEQHWSQLRARGEYGVSGNLADWGRFRIVARAEVDAAYRLENDFYPDAVRRDQESDFVIREAYLDFALGDWEYRAGRQQVVWGEMVGLFLADVVSARDTREFFLPEFEAMRIAQWAVRAERFSGDSHFELLWVPYASYDRIGKPGADFYPFPLPAGTGVKEVIPDRGDWSHHAFGGRYSRLLAGWDLSAFYYQSNDVQPTLYRLDSGLELRHDRIEQLGGTFSKDLGSIVLKGETVYTYGRSWPSEDPLAPYGLYQSDVLEYIAGVMIPRGDWRFDLQFYGRHSFDYDPQLLLDEDEFGITLLVNRRFSDRLEGEILYLAGLNRSDYSVQPSLSWNISQTLRLQFGADLFGGDSLGYYGRFSESDRLFLALRKWY